MVTGFERYSKKTKRALFLEGNRSTHGASCARWWSRIIPRRAADAPSFRLAPPRSPSPLGGPAGEASYHRGVDIAGADGVNAKFCAA